MSLGYVSEKLSNAINIMATSSASIQQRLKWAADASKTLASRMHDCDFPSQELADRWNGWWTRITSRAAVGDEGTIAATINLLSDEEASQVAKELFEIYSEVEYFYSKAN